MYHFLKDFYVSDKEIMSVCENSINNSSVLKCILLDYFHLQVVYIFLLLLNCFACYLDRVVKLADYFIQFKLNLLISIFIILYELNNWLILDMNFTQYQFKLFFKVWSFQICEYLIFIIVWSILFIKLSDFLVLCQLIKLSFINLLSKWFFTLI